MEVDALGVVLVVIKVWSQGWRLVPERVPSSHHVVSPLPSLGPRVEFPDVRLHLQVELSNVCVFILCSWSWCSCDPGSPICGLSFLSNVISVKPVLWKSQTLFFLASEMVTLCRTVGAGPSSPSLPITQQITQFIVLYIYLCFGG